jgi:Dyp-type peroxidase family
MKNQNTQPIEPLEPVLPLEDIQGIAAPGFFKPHQTLLGVAVKNDATAIQSFKKLLLKITREISSARKTLDDRREFRATGVSKAKKGGLLMAVAFSSTGLRTLTPGSTSIPSDAFQQGLAARSAFLGDPTGKDDEGNAKNWKVGAPKNELDALFIIAGNTRAAVAMKSKTFLAELKRSGLKVAYKENGHVREDLPGHEHFGFDDGVSQPGIRGRASEKADDFITPRFIAISQVPESSLFGYPGQDLVWPGVFLLGHPATSPDPLIAGIPTQPIPEWTRNGSFLVFRRLRQDVGLFWRTMKSEADRLKKLPGFENFTDEVLASRIVGRWPSGAPVNRTPGDDNPKLGKSKVANNHFRFDSNACPMRLAHGESDPFPQSKADPVGLACPWAAHIRKVNTRDSGSDMGGRESTYARRLLRVGVPFGEPLSNRYAETKNDPQNGERGLLFLSIQASIEDQFEFLAVKWMGDPSRPKMPGGYDLLVGQNNDAKANRVRTMAIFGSGNQQASVATAAQWIVPTGGGYFFVPSISALTNVLTA